MQKSTRFPTLRRSVSYVAPVIATAMLIAGCDSCGSKSAAPTATDQAQEAPQAADKMPAVESGKLDAKKPLIPTRPAQEVPTPNLDELEDDCFVLIDAYPDYGPPPLAVEFEADVDCTTGEPTYSWDFGDGSALSGEKNPKHTYESEGEFIAVLTITGRNGGVEVDEFDIFVEADAE